MAAAPLVRPRGGVWQSQIAVSDIKAQNPETAVFHILYQHLTHFLKSVSSSFGPEQSSDPKKTFFHWDIPPPISKCKNAKANQKKRRPMDVFNLMSTEPTHLDPNRLKVEGTSKGKSFLHNVINQIPNRYQTRRRYSHLIG